MCASMLQDEMEKPILAIQNTFDTGWKDSKISDKKTKAINGCNKKQADLKQCSRVMPTISLICSP